MSKRLRLNMKLKDIMQYAVCWYKQVCISLLLISYDSNQSFVLTTQLAMIRRIVTCFRDVAIYI